MCLIDMLFKQLFCVPVKKVTLVGSNSEKIKVKSFGLPSFDDFQNLPLKDIEFFSTGQLFTITN